MQPVSKSRTNKQSSCRSGGSLDFWVGSKPFSTSAGLICTQCKHNFATITLTLQAASWIWLHLLNLLPNEQFFFSRHHDFSWCEAALNVLHLLIWNWRVSSAAFFLPAAPEGGRSSASLLAKLSLCNQQPFIWDDALTDVLGRGCAAPRSCYRSPSWADAQLCSQLCLLTASGNSAGCAASNSPPGSIFGNHICIRRL